MYKKQMTLQKIVCLLVILASALVFIYSLGIMTDLYDALYRTMRDPNNLAKTSVEGSRIYYDMQDFNNGLLKAGIGLILGSCQLFLTNTHTRRKYYIGNYCAITANVAANVGIAIWAHSQIEAFKAQFFPTWTQKSADNMNAWVNGFTGDGSTGETMEEKGFEKHIPTTCPSDF